MPSTSLLTPVHLGALPIERFASLLPPADYAKLQAGAAAGAAALEGRVLWNVNSTDRGGGVAEMLRPLLSYARGAGVDARWLVMAGSDEFFRLTKRLHNLLHAASDAAPLEQGDREVYDRVSAATAVQLMRHVTPRDVVILHDPQTAGMIPALVERGVPVIWRCHVGIDSVNEAARSAIEFLLPCVRRATRTVFSREAYVWDGIDRARARIIRPSIDALSPKNQPLEPETVRSILITSGIAAGETTSHPIFTRVDGSRGRVGLHAEMDEDEPLRAGARFVLQVSRWDRLKDPAGVLAGFAEHVHHDDAPLVLAGPAPSAIQDDPEGGQVLEQVRRARAERPPEQRRRIHIAMLPMDDAEENAALVNALQRAATIVVQKSLAEGFGLTVAEAMWKGRPVVASAVGGILDQIEDGVTGVLVTPTDLRAFGAAIDELLSDRARAESMGAAAHQRVQAEFLSSRHLLDYVDLVLGIVST